MEATVIGTRHFVIGANHRSFLHPGRLAGGHWRHHLLVRRRTGRTARVSSKPSLASPPHSADASPSAKALAPTGDRLHLSGECVKDAAFLGALDVPGVATHAPEASGPKRMAEFLWATLGALDDPSFVVPPGTRLRRRRRAPFVRLKGTAMYILDSDVCIELMRGNMPAVREVLEHTSPRLIKIPAVVRYELVCGALQKRPSGKESADHRNVPGSIRNASIRCALRRRRRAHQGRLGVERTEDRPYRPPYRGNRPGTWGRVVTRNTRRVAKVGNLALETWTT